MTDPQMAGKHNLRVVRVVGVCSKEPWHCQRHGLKNRLLAYGQNVNLRRRCHEPRVDDSSHDADGWSSVLFGDKH